MKEKCVGRGKMKMKQGGELTKGIQFTISMLTGERRCKKMGHGGMVGRGSDFDTGRRG